MNNTVEFYLSFFFCICVLAFVCVGFVVNHISYIPNETNFVPFESELLLRSELSVVTLGKSLPGNCSKLGHFVSLGFLVNNFSYIPIETNFVPFSI